MKQKSWRKKGWSLVLLSLFILVSYSTGFAQRVRRLGVAGGCSEPVKGCWSSIMTSWPLEAVHSNLGRPELSQTLPPGLGKC